MAISLKTGLKQSQKLALTQSLKQAIELLQLSNIELYERISSELVENPLIEEEPVSSSSPLPAESDLMIGVTRNLIGEDMDLSRDNEQRAGFEDSSDTGYTGEGDDDRKRSYIENAITHEESLTEHLLWQARFSAENDREMEAYQAVITSLDENGFLLHQPPSLQDSDVTSLDIQKIISVINLFDPVGCAAGSVRESLIVQSKYYYPSDVTLLRILDSCFHHFERLDYQMISKELNIPLAEVLDKSRIIQGLDPYPGRQYSTRAIRYVVPDIDVKLVDGEIIVTINDDWIPRIRINLCYILMLKKKNIEKNLREYIQDKMYSARHLIRNISNRRNTILRVVGMIMERQRDFLERGPGHLKPLTNSEVAEKLNLHESTVSRVTSGKYVQTVWGVQDLKYFFVSRLKSSGSEETSSDEVMRLMRDIVHSENAESPRSDEDIARIIGKAGIHVARRTVAKYRGLLGIPPSNKRKKINQIRPEEHQ
ncbi:MAG: RNA polymerase factor sigma-54 [Chrysiogenales bacterium]|nr:MAG: RNA polymerase factor sigma-54 [Chrysiogenales bacterium]